MYRRETENKFRALEILVSEYLEQNGMELDTDNDAVTFINLATGEEISAFDLLTGECD